MPSSAYTGSNRPFNDVCVSFEPRLQTWPCHCHRQLRKCANIHGLIREPLRCDQTIRTCSCASENMWQYPPRCRNRDRAHIYLATPETKKTSILAAKIRPDVQVVIICMHESQNGLIHHTTPHTTTNSNARMISLNKLPNVSSNSSYHYVSNECLKPAINIMQHPVLCHTEKCYLHYSCTCNIKTMTCVGIHYTIHTSDAAFETEVLVSRLLEDKI